MTDCKLPRNSSPIKFSENGGNILSGRGIDAVRQRVKSAFDNIRQPEPARGGDPFYQDVEERAKLFTAAALASKLYSVTVNQGPIEISSPVESAAQLFALCTRVAQ